MKNSYRFNFNYRAAGYFLFGLLFAMVAGCALDNSEQENAYKVSWTPQLDWSYMVDREITATQKADLENMMSSAWVDAFQATSGEDDTEQPIEIGDCQQYLTAATSNLYEVHPYNQGPFLSHAMICRASEILIHAQDAKTSFIPKNWLNDALPTKLPAQFGFIISQEQQDKVDQDASIRHWADINPNLTYKKVSETEAKYSDDSDGVQTLKLIGRGDFNDDGIEDVLIQTKYTIVNASYIHMALFSFTVDAKGEWHLIKEFTW